LLRYQSYKMGKKSAKERQMKATGLSGPGLPEQKKVNTVVLEDGTEVPVGRPAGVSDAQYEQVLQYLKANPAQAKEQLEKTREALSNNPMMVQSLLAQQHMMSNPEAAQGMARLKDDPEFAQMFEEIKKEGPDALMKYWDDTEMMSKISKKMEGARITPPAGSEGVAGSEGPKKVKSVTVETIHDAAKVGDVAVLLKFIDADKKCVNSKDARGISPLGVAVGFNRIEAVKTLLASGADPNITDPKGNTPLHYACGYGRKECAELLLGSGATAGVENTDGQTPIAVAELNKETHMVKFMREQGGSVSSDPYL